MPLREYQCKKCKHRFEKIEKFSDKPLKKCPECGGPLEEVISAPAVQFKGSGWYVTDYARKGSTSAGSSSGEGDGGAKEGKESGKETAKETKKEEKPKTEAASKKTKKE
jgi:putative FmdB family regulatory protein